MSLQASGKRPAGLIEEVRPQKRMTFGQISGAKRLAEPEEPLSSKRLQTGESTQRLRQPKRSLVRDRSRQVRTRPMLPNAERPTIPMDEETLPAPPPLQPPSEDVSMVGDLPAEPEDEPVQPQAAPPTRDDAMPDAPISKESIDDANDAYKVLKAAMRSKDVELVDELLQEFNQSPSLLQNIKTASKLEVRQTMRKAIKFVETEQTRVAEAQRQQSLRDADAKDVPMVDASEDKDSKAIVPLGQIPPNTSAQNQSRFQMKVGPVRSTRRGRLPSGRRIPMQESTTRARGSSGGPGAKPFAKLSEAVKEPARKRKKRSDKKTDDDTDDDETDSPIIQNSQVNRGATIVVPQFSNSSDVARTANLFGSLGVLLTQPKTAHTKQVTTLVQNMIDHPEIKK